MIPILYSNQTTDFQNYGMGHLVESIKCEVTEERNGMYELELQYPITGKLYQDIAEDCFIKAKPNESDPEQLFNIYRITKPMNGIITCYAEHISYQLNDNVVSDFSVVGSAGTAMQKLFDKALLQHPFHAWSNISTIGTLTVLQPSSVRSWLGGKEGSILDIWGGEYAYNNYDVKLYQQRGNDLGVVIEYGKNLTDLEQEKSISEMYTALYPYATYQPETPEGGETPPQQRIEIPNKILVTETAENYSHVKIAVRDFTQDFEDGEVITPELLETRARLYIKAAGMGIPSVNIKASFVQLWQTLDYQHQQTLERVSLCDTVTVRFTKLGVDVKAKVIKTIYDTLNEKYVSIELGNAKSSFVDTVNNMSDISNEIDKVVIQQSKDFEKRLESVIKEVTEAITGQTGGYVVLNPAEHPREILIMDTPDMATAVNVWRWNLAGLAHSKTGVNGPYTTAITADGKIVADFILAGTLEGALLKAGSVTTEALSVEFKKYLTDQFTGIVTEVTQLFQAADGELNSIIQETITNSNEVLQGNLDEAERQLNTKISTLRQTVDSFSLIFEEIGAGGTRKGQTEITIDGIKVFNGAIEVYNGEKGNSEKVMYVDKNGNLTTNTLKVTDDKRASVIVEGKGEKSIYLHTTDGQGGAFLSLEEGDGYKTVLGIYRHGSNEVPSSNLVIDVYSAGSGVVIIRGADAAGSYYDATLKVYGKINILGENPQLTIAGYTLKPSVYNNLTYIWLDAPFWVKNTLHIDQHALFDDQNYLTTGSRLWVKGDGWFDGKVTAAGWGETSDISLKENIKANFDFDALALILKMRGIAFDYKEEFTKKLRNSIGGHVDYGFTAQHLEKIHPQLVLKPVSPDGEMIYQINMPFLTFLSIRSIQQLNEKMQEQQQKIQELEARIAKLEELITE